MKRLLLLLPTRGYRAEDFIAAADGLEIELTVASEIPSSLEAQNPGGLLTLDFDHPDHAARQTLRFHERFPIDAVVGVDDSTSLLQAVIGQALGLSTNPPEAVATARNKFRMREKLREAGLPGPWHHLFSVDDDPAELAQAVPYPCVLKPLVLSASRGVIRADSPAEFEAAFYRLRGILADPEVAAMGEPARQILVEGFLPGLEVALEGLLVDGRLQVLAIFDKPDPLDGPFFEETIYVTPSTLRGSVRNTIRDIAARSARALGLVDGPIHAEFRVDGARVVPLEINPRPIGGRCSRVLRFGAGGLSLEEIILRLALRMDIPSMMREQSAAGVMMIPVPGGGTLRSICGQENAEKVPGIVEILMNTRPGQKLVALPEGSTYLGFIFARTRTPHEAIASLREAHDLLQFEIE